MTKSISFDFYPPRENSKEVSITIEVTDEPVLSAKLISGELDPRDYGEAFAYAIDRFNEKVD